MRNGAVTTTGNDSDPLCAEAWKLGVEILRRGYEDELPAGYDEDERVAGERDL